MSRNMIEANKAFFSHIQSMLDEDLAKQVPDSIRYIATNDEEKTWLKSLAIKHSFRISKDAFALLLCFEHNNFLCLVNVGAIESKLPPRFTEVSVNAGVITVLGAEGYLTSKIDRARQLQIYDNVMYNTSEDAEYHGHHWTDIMNLFLPVYCYKLNLEGEDFDIREDTNAFYQILCQAVFEADAGNNPYTEQLKNVWEKIFYEGALSKINYKNILMSYIALTWDISYLYLYQCIEDKFACEAVRPLHTRLGLSISELDLSRVLYDELSWQPKDIEGIERIINKCPNTRGVDILQTVAGEEKLSKYIYSLRNSIVHETRDSKIPINDDPKWDKVIEGILYLLLEI